MNPLGKLMYQSKYSDKHPTSPLRESINPGIFFPYRFSALIENVTDAILNRFQFALGQVQDRVAIKASLSMSPIGALRVSSAAKHLIVRGVHVLGQECQERCFIGVCFKHVGGAPEQHAGEMAKDINDDIVPDV